MTEDQAAIELMYETGLIEKLAEAGGDDRRYALIDLFLRKYGEEIKLRAMVGQIVGEK